VMTSVDPVTIGPPPWIGQVWLSVIRAAGGMGGNEKLKVQNQNLTAVGKRPGFPPEREWRRFKSARCVIHLIGSDGRRERFLPVVEMTEVAKCDG
jgi:hypothetical protein